MPQVRHLNFLHLVPQLTGTLAQTVGSKEGSNTLLRANHLDRSVREIAMILFKSFGTDLTETFPLS